MSKKDLILNINHLINHQGELYRQNAKRNNLSESESIILYALYAEERPMLQKEIGLYLCQPKQTVSTALKKMEKDGLIVMSETGQRRRKEISLSEAGKRLAEAKEGPVLKAEKRALASMSKDELNRFVELLEIYTQHLEKEMENIDNVKENTAE